jgi:hypothetical protein
MTVHPSSPTMSLNLKQNVTPSVNTAPPCNGVPWAGIVAGTANGVQEVSVSGGVLPDDSTSVPTITVTGPGGINDTLGPDGTKTYSPAANGTWTVTTTVCGITKTSTITLP